MTTVYGDIYSGNCYKVRLTMAHLNVPCDWRHIDILAGESRTDEFLALNANGKIPLLQRDDGSTLSESGAIIWYLAEGSHLIPDDARLRAQMLQWMFFEQYSHEPYIAVARFMVRYLDQALSHAELLSEKQQRGYQALAVMELHLADHDYFAGAYSLADIALFAYTHVAHEGNMALDDYPAIGEWLARVETQPGFRSMDSFARAI